MKYIKNIIKKEILQLESEEKREKLRKYNDEYLSETIDGLNTKFIELEEKILDDIRKEEYDLIFLPLKKEEWEALKDVFFPIPPLNMKTYNSIEKGILLLEDSELMSIENEIFTGDAIVNEEKYKVEFKFKKIDIERQLEEKIYNIFKINGVKWKTLNLKYFSKYYEIEILTLIDNIETDKIKLEYDLGKYNEFWHKDYEIYWNLENKIILSNLMNNEIKDEGIFQHYLEINSDYKYLVYSEKLDNILSVARNNEKIEICSKEKNIDFYNILVLHDDISSKRLEGLIFSCASNKRKKLFSEMIKQKKSRSRSEIFKVFKSFYGTENLKILDFKINGYVEKTEKIQKYNNFLENEIYAAYNRDKLYLYLKYENSIENESFLKLVLSELQYKFNEFEFILIKV